MSGTLEGQGQGWRGLRKVEPLFRSLSLLEEGTVSDHWLSTFHECPTPMMLCSYPPPQELMSKWRCECSKLMGCLVCWSLVFLCDFHNPTSHFHLFGYVSIRHSLSSHYDRASASVTCGLSSPWRWQDGMAQEGHAQCFWDG